MSYVFWKPERERWHAFVEPEDAADGLRHFLSTGIKDETETRKGRQKAERWLEDYLEEQCKIRKTGIVPVAEKKTVRQFCEEYLKARNKHEGCSREGGIIKQFLDFKIANSVIGGMNLAAVKESHVQTYLNSKRQIVLRRKDGTQSVRKASPGNAIRHRITLRAVFAAAEAMKPPLLQPGSNPVAGTKVDDYEDRRHRELRSEEQARMAPFIEDPVRLPGLFRLGRLVEFALYTLMRQEEIFRCKWRDIDLRQRKLPDGSTSYGTVTVVSEGENQTKSRTTRQVEIYPPLRELLLKMQDEAMKEVGGTPAAIEDRPVFISRDGGGYTCIKVSWEALKRRAKVQNLKFHDLRRTGAMRYHRLGVPVTVLQTMLGHSDISVTMRYLGLVGREQTPSLNRAWQAEQKAAAERNRTEATGRS
jgi:integrase